MKVSELVRVLTMIEKNGFGDLPVMIEESGEGYFGDLHHVDSMGKSITLIGTRSGTESV